MKRLRKVPLDYGNPNAGNGYVAMTLDNVEAVAACEVSSDSSKNKGVCERDVNGTEDYCVRSNWGIQRCATIY